MSDIITVTMGALQMEFDNEVVRAVQNVGIDVDKEKLIEALQLAESLVRCKDCKHSHMTYDGRCKYCDKWEEDGGALYLDGDFYCAYGERREDGEA